MVMSSRSTWQALVQWVLRSTRSMLRAFAERLAEEARMRLDMMRPWVRREGFLTLSSLLLQTLWRPCFAPPSARRALALSLEQIDRSCRLSPGPADERLTATNACSARRCIRSAVVGS
jgi:hypothetical protein